MTGIKDVTTFTGKDISAWEIAWPLSQQCRFNGHIPIFWDVLSHTGLVYQLAMTEMKRDIDVPTQIALLLHDAPEAYLGDLPRPLKRMPQFAAFQDVEAITLKRMLERFDVSESQIDWEFVQRYDNQALYVEFHILFEHIVKNSEFAAWVPQPEYPLNLAAAKLVKLKPLDYIECLRNLAINNNVHQVNELFELPEHMQDIIYPPVVEQRLDGIPSSDDILNARL